MQINPVNQVNTDYGLPVRAASKKPEVPAAKVKIETEPPPETADQTEVTDVSPISGAKTIAVEQNTSLKFSRDRQTNELIVELVNAQTGESLRQTPSEVSLKLSAIYSGLQGKLVNKNF